MLEGTRKVRQKIGLGCEREITVTTMRNGDAVRVCPDGGLCHEEDHRRLCERYERMLRIGPGRGRCDDNEDPIVGIKIEVSTGAVVVIVWRTEYRPPDSMDGCKVIRSEEFFDSAPDMLAFVCGLF